ncbi:MAG TPA: hypothetical protein VK929_04525 [Longimicrobiales bacterium]|nr:hypothetical protein [Longimicrobiales bacterium]
MATRVAALILPFITVLAAGACGDGRGGIDLVHADSPPVPASRGELRIDSDQPLAFGAVLSLDSTTLLASDRTTGDVWLLDAGTREVRMEKLLPGDQRARARLIAMRAVADTFELLDRSGTLYRFDRSTRAGLGTSRIDVGTSTLVAAAANARGDLALLVRRMGRQEGTAFEYALVLRDADGGLRDAWQGAPMGSVPTTSPDMLSLAPDGDGWVLTGTAPPRILRFDASGSLRREAAIEATPLRRLSPELVASIRASAEAAGFGGRVQPPQHFPPITAMRPAGAAWLAVPYTGGPTGEAQGLDVYCYDRYSHTILDSPLIQQVLLADHGVVVIAENDERSWTVEFYPLASLPLDCEAGS